MLNPLFENMAGKGIPQFPEPIGNEPLVSW